MEERAPAGLGGEPLARGPAYFLLISSRKPAPCASLRTALGRGESRVMCLLPPAPCPLSPSCPLEGRGRGNLAAPVGGNTWLPGLQPSVGRWDLEPGRCGAPAASSFCRKRELCGLGPLWEGGEQGGAGSPSPRGWVCRVKAVLTTVEAGGRVAECPRLLAGGLGRWGLGQGSEFKGHSETPRSSYLGDRWGCAGVGVQGMPELQRQLASAGWAKRRPHQPKLAPTSAHLPQSCQKTIFESML